MAAPADPLSKAYEWWRIAPPETCFVPPAIYLPGQFARIRRTEFGEIPDVVRHFRGGFESEEGPTLGYALRDADLVDGILYAGAARRCLRPGARPAAARPSVEEHTSGVVYESWNGHRWFGNWLTEDCLAYALAERFGVPVATAPGPSGHAPEYERLFGHRPRRFARVHFDELILVDDHANNADRRARHARLAARLRIGIEPEDCPGVFLTRGHSGDRRFLLNEAEIAARLRDEHGFLILDPMTLDVPELVAACAGARVIAGVEGSQLTHGLFVMRPDATLLTLQPPDRVTSALKTVTDRQGQGYALVVGVGDRHGFYLDWNDVAGTLTRIAERDDRVTLL